jgi:hypothetical protein
VADLPNQAPPLGREHQCAWTCTPEEEPLDVHARNVSYIASNGCTTMVPAVDTYDVAQRLPDAAIDSLGALLKKVSGGRTSNSEPEEKLI